MTVAIGSSLALNTDSLSRMRAMVAKMRVVLRMIARSARRKRLGISLDGINHNMLK